MPIFIQSNLKTPQPYIPVSGKGDQHKLLGTYQIFESVADLKLAVDDQRTSLENGLAVSSYLLGTRIHVAGEEVHRVWTRGTGGTDAAIAASSHARRVVFAPGKTVLLDGDLSVLMVASGQPANGTGNDGDGSFDSAAGLVYKKTAGAWVVALNLAVQSGITEIAPGGGAPTTSYKLNGVLHTVTYPTSTTQVDVGGGVTTTITRDGSGNLVSLVRS